MSKSSSKLDTNTKQFDKTGQAEMPHKSRSVVIKRKVKKVNVESGKKIIERLWKEHGTKCLNYLCDIAIDYGVDIEVKNEYKDQFLGTIEDINSTRSTSQILKKLFGPLLEIKILGIKIFKFIIEYYEREEMIEAKSRLANMESIHKIDSGIESGELEIDWEGMYGEVRSEISKLLQEDKHKEAKEEIKKIVNIPLEERVKIVKSKSETIKKIKGSSEEEAVGKYVNNEEERKKCLTILEDIREGRMEIEDRNGYCDGEDNDFDEEICNDPLLKAVKQSIEANDLPNLITLSKGCYLPSDISILSDFDGNFYTLFEYSCMVYADECALYLLEAGGGIKQEFENGDNPLHQSLRAGNEGIGMFLIEIGADYNELGPFRYTTLHAASAGDCHEVAKFLIDKGADIDAKDVVIGRTPLYHAAKMNSIEVAKLLIERGANIKKIDVDGTTPLHEAASGNSIEIVKLLIERGVDIKVKTFSGLTLLHSAASGNGFDVAKLLIDKGLNIEEHEGRLERTPLHLAAENNSIEVAKLLIDRGANIKAKDSYGKTPLHVAAFENSIEVANLLIERGADIEANDGKRMTPLHLAAEENCFEVSKLLLEKGANIQAKDRYQKTPLHEASVGNCTEVAELLIERGADIEAKDEKGKTPLYCAVKMDSFEVAELLIERGADVNAKTKNGKTPIHRAAKNNGFEIAKLLIERGANIEEKDKNGKTPHHYASEMNSIEVSKLLMDK